MFTARALKLTARTFTHSLDVPFSTAARSRVVESLTSDRLQPPEPLMTVRHRLARAVAVGALALAGVTALPTAPAQADATASGDVIANLWSYNWDSVASECTDVLGPNGYGAVWVAPPAE